MAGGAEGDVDTLVYNTFFKDKSKGTFVDVGAAGPEYLSIGNGFRRRGWRVVSVEPNPAFAGVHREKGYEIAEYAAGTEDEDNVDFTVYDFKGAPYEGGEVSFESFSSLGMKEGFAQSLEAVGDHEANTIKVNVRKLRSIFREFGIHRPDAISVDVEGWEIEALSGLDFKTQAPDVMIVENLYDAPHYTEFAEAVGYKLWRIVSPNYVYVRRDVLASSSFGTRFSYWLWKTFKLPGHKPNRPPTVNQRAKGQTADD